MSPAACCKYGIPDFRLPNEVIDAEIDKLRQLGVKFECNTLVGRLFTIEQMLDRAGIPRGIHRHRRRLSELHGHSRRVAERRAFGERAADALQSDARARFPDFDTPLQLGRRVAVIGAGNTAMDALAGVACDSAPSRCLRLSAQPRPRPRRAPRKSITPSRKASSSTG